MSDGQLGDSGLRLGDDEHRDHEVEYGWPPGVELDNSPSSLEFNEFLGDLAHGSQPTESVYCFCARVFPDCNPATRKMRDQNSLWVPLCERCAQTARDAGVSVRMLLSGDPTNY